MNLQGDAPSGILTLRIIISGKYVGHIIGKGGERSLQLKNTSMMVPALKKSTLEMSHVQRELLQW